MMLAPAGLLVLMLLGGLAVDSAIAYGAQRELESRIAGAVNDASVLSLTPEELQRGENAQMSEGDVARIVRQRVAVSNPHGLSVDPTAVVVNTDVEAGIVEVVAQGTAPYVFAKAIPGRGKTATVRSSMSVQLNYRGPE